MNSEIKFDIVKLIEKNSITRLNKDYKNKLVNKIKENFTNNEQQLFLASFYCYLNYESKKDFVIDFDNVWKWCGFTRKSDGKRLLEKYFIIDIDYQVKKLEETIFRNLAENKNKTDVIKALIKHGALIDKTEIGTYESPLVKAIKNNRLDIIKLLVKLGANIEKINEYNNLSPLKFAIYFSNIDTIKLLVELGAKIYENDIKLAIDEKKRRNS